MVETPVLFITFVRPDYALQTFNGIKAAQPKKLYFYSNKGRAEKEGEIVRNEEIRTYIKKIDWDCEVHTFFRDECVDVYTSLKSAIDWFFENEEQGIILEEDCVPTKAFFSYVDQLINKFKNDYRVWCISGDNIIQENPSGYDYFYSHLHAMYGWASWRSRWQMVNWDNLHIDETIQSHLYERLFKTKEQAKAKESFLIQKKDFLNSTKCWDYIFGLAMDQYGAVTIQPKEHLVKNIGIQGQHHKKAEVSKYNRDSNCASDIFTISNDPPFVIADMEHDYRTYCQLLRKPNIVKRIIHKILKSIR